MPLNALCPAVEIAPRATKANSSFVIGELSSLVFSATIAGHRVANAFLPVNLCHLHTASDANICDTACIMQVEKLLTWRTILSDAK